MKLTKPSNVNMLEKKLTTNLEKDSDRLIKKLQKLGVDPICFTDYVRSRTRNFDSQRFRENYSDMDIHVKAHVNLVQTGISQ
ncbi:Ger(x)C family spore germination C-terminal domain-containing protein [Priestia flexa]|nr:Ger(x)C family spore germination C-terminal domain-containing protein [Priestia flexa]